MKFFQLAIPYANTGGLPRYGLKLGRNRAAVSLFDRMPGRERPPGFGSEQGAHILAAKGMSRLSVASPVPGLGMTLSNSTATYDHIGELRD